MTNAKKMIIDADVHVTPVQDNELCTTFDRMIEYMVNQALTRCAASRIRLMSKPI